MRVLIVTNMYPSEGDVSWRGSFVKEQVELYKSHNPDAKVDVFHIKGKVSGGRDFNYLAALPSLIRQLLFGRYDIVHCHHAFCVLLCIPWFFRLIYTVHEGELNHVSWRSAIIKVAIYLSRVPIFVSHNEFVRTRCKRKKFLPCGVNIELFMPVKSRGGLKSALGISPLSFVVLFPADPRRPEKNANILKEVEIISAKKDRDWIYIYGGSIPRSEMPLWIAASDVVASIGRFESDGLVIKEAMACNTPVVATNVGNAKLYVSEGSGFIVKAEPCAVFDAIDYISAQPLNFAFGREKLISLGQDAQSTVKQLHAIYKESVY